MTHKQSSENSVSGDQLENILDRFEQAWANGERPEIEDFVTGEGSDRQKLLLELIKSDLEFRLKEDPAFGIEVYLDKYPAIAEQKDGQLIDLIKAEMQLRRSVSVDEYLKRFPNLEKPINELFNDLTLSLKNAEGDPGDRTSENKPNESKPSSVAPDIENYQILELIAEGGMGSVWRANQTAPLRRQVAIKVIKRAIADKEVIARFEAERQALAMMEHSNIAKVLAAGTTIDDQPYFVMEYVEGVPITKYCDEHRFSISERLELFVPVCKAVQHAHQKGILHRDLKPSNVLVAIEDGKPVPKVIDFGLAKAIEHTNKLSDESIYTGYGKIVGTVQYMSPEQAELNESDVDTRTDIYSLGVMLYEMLTGSTPLDKETVIRNPLLKILELIRNYEPEKPSDRLSSSVGTISTISEQRKITPAKLKQILHGELDWVVMKALNNDRSRRYEAAIAFAEDVERYLNEQPVVARPPSTLYSIQKFARRNRMGVIAACVIALTLIGGVVATTLAMFRAQRAEELAESREITERSARIKAEQETLAKEKALKEKQAALEQEKKQKEYAEAVADFVEYDFLALTSVEGQERAQFLGAGLTTGLAKDTTLRQLLDRAALLLDERKNLDPIIESRLLLVIGNSYRANGDAERAVPFLERALELRKAALPENHRGILISINNLANACLFAGDHAKALPLFRKSLQLTKAKLGKNHRDTITCENSLAFCFLQIGQFSSAIQLFEETLDLSRSNLGNDHHETLIVMNNLATSYQRAGRLNEAISLFEDTLTLSKAKLGDGHLITLINMNDLAVGLLNAGRPNEAIELLKKTLELTKSKLGEEHPQTLTVMNNLSSSYRDTYQLKKAIELQEMTLKLRTDVLGQSNPETLISMGNLARCYHANGELDNALVLYEQTLRLTKKHLGDNHPNTLIAMNNLAVLYADIGEATKATELNETAFVVTKSKFGVDHPEAITCLNNLALAYADAEQYGISVPLLKQSLELNKEKFGPDHPNTLMSMNNLGTVYSEAGYLDKSRLLLEQTHRMMAANFGSGHPATLNVLGNLAKTHGLMGQLDHSIQMLESVLKQQETALGRKHPYTLKTIANLGVNYREAERYDEALKLLEEVVDQLSIAPNLKWSRFELLATYRKAGQFEQLTKMVKQNEENIRKTLPVKSIGLAKQLAKMSLELIEAGKYQYAEQLIRECLDIIDEKNPESWQKSETMSMLGGALTGRAITAQKDRVDESEHTLQQLLDEAEPLLINGYNGMKERVDSIPEHIRTQRLTEALDRLIKYAAITKDETMRQKWQLEKESIDNQENNDAEKSTIDDGGN